MAISKPWWDIFPSTPAEAIERTLDEPVVSPIGLFGIGAKKLIIKQAGSRLIPILGGAAGGFLLSRLFGGGGTQEQEQEATITPTVSPVQAPNIPIIQRPITITHAPVTTTTTTAVDYSPITTLMAGRDIGYSGAPFHVGTTTTPTVTAPVSTIAEPYLPQITVVPSMIGQQQEATQKPDNTLLLVIGAVAIGAMFLMRGK